MGKRSENGREFAIGTQRAHTYRYFTQARVYEEKMKRKEGSTTTMRNNRKGL
jgi:hypothetical protein